MQIYTDQHIFIWLTDVKYGYKSNVSSLARGGLIELFSRLHISHLTSRQDIK